MKVILREEIDNLGKGGDIVAVKNGYARNYLIPRGLAVLASTKNLKGLEHERRLISARLAKRMKSSQTLAEKLENFSCTIQQQVGDSEKLFGSVTSMDIEKVLKEAGFEIDRRKIVLPEPIKSLGVFTVPIKLGGNVEAKLKVWVVKQEESTKPV